jgi:hypothetical protein
MHTPVARRGRVQPCKLAQNLAHFPDEVTSIAAAPHRDHCRFRQRATFII